MFLGSVAIPGGIHNYGLIIPRPFDRERGEEIVDSATEDMARAVLRRVEQSVALRPTLIRTPYEYDNAIVVRRVGKRRILPYQLVLDGDPEGLADVRLPEFAESSWLPTPRLAQTAGRGSSTPGAPRRSVIDVKSFATRPTRARKQEARRTNPPGCAVSRPTAAKPSSNPMEEGDDGANAYSIVDDPISCSVYLRQRDADESDGVIGVANSVIRGALRGPDRLDREPRRLDPPIPAHLEG